MRVRIRFTKEDTMKYIGHLDVMRYFQKAIRRAGLDVTYSGGFHPHMLMSFALPLSVGVTSSGEYFDLDLNSAVSSGAMREALEKQMARGVHVCSVRLISGEKKDKAMSLVAAADYLAETDMLRDLPEDAVNDLIQDFLAEKEILILKKTKKGERELNILPLIYRFVFQDGKFFLRISAGSKDNLRPEYVLNALAEYARVPAPERIRLHRLELYAIREGSEDHSFISLEELGEEIVSTADHCTLSE